MRHIISILVENKFGVLSRIAALFSGRGYNIESISSAPTLNERISVMTIVTHGDDGIIEQITKQLNKTIDVIKIVDLTESEHVEREMILIKVAPPKKDRIELLRIAEIFRGRVLDSSPDAYTIEVTGDEKKIDAFIEMTRPMGIKECVRTGKVAISREVIRKKKDSN